MIYDMPMPVKPGPCGRPFQHKSTEGDPQLG